MLIPKNKPIRLQKLRDSAKGAPCTIESPVCNRNPDTSVLAHFRASWTNAGMKLKPDDTAGAIACSACHDWIGDGLSKSKCSNENEKQFFWFRGVLRTVRYWVEEGILK